MINEIKVKGELYILQYLYFWDLILYMLFAVLNTHFERVFLSVERPFAILKNNNFYI